MYLAGILALPLFISRNTFDRSIDVVTVVGCLTLLLGLSGGIYNLFRSVQRSWLGILGLVFNGITIAVLVIVWLAAG